MAMRWAILENNKKVKVKKNNNALQEFNVDKIIASCMNAGASFVLASKIASKIAETVDDGTTTSEIRKIVYTRLKKENPKTF